MALLSSPRLGTPKTLTELVTALNIWLKLVQEQVNRVSSDFISGHPTAATSPPTVGSNTLYSQGDRIMNLQPTELGSTGSKYVVTGWICVAGGQPGTWVQMRTLTGN